MDKFYQLIERNKKKIDFIKEYLNQNQPKYIKIKPPKEINIIKFKDKDQIDIKPKIINKRNSGVDLIRIVAMIGIVYTHLLYQGKGLSKFNRNKKKLICLYTYVFWHNNAFALLSGMVGYKSTKYSNLLYLWLYVVFYSVGIHYYYLKFNQGARIHRKFYKDYYPVIYNRYWYFSSYFGMFIFLPAVNKGLQYLSKTEFKLLVMSILGILVFWFNYIDSGIDVFKMMGGYTPIWLLCLFIIGAYIEKFNLIYAGIKRYIFIIFYLFIFLFLCAIYNKFIDYENTYINGNYSIKLRNFIMSKKQSSFIRTIQAIVITLFFLQLETTNIYLNLLLFLVL